MRFFADPWLFNCRNETSRRRSSRPSRPPPATRTARGRPHRRGRERGHRPNHPVTDEISPDYPPGCGGDPPGPQPCAALPGRCPVSSSSPRPARRTCCRGTRATATSLTSPRPAVAVPDPDVRSEPGRVLSTYSSTASDLDLEAVLGGVVEDASGNYYAWLNGTSMAAPDAAGVVALIRPPIRPCRKVPSRRCCAAQRPVSHARQHSILASSSSAPRCRSARGSGNNNFYGKGLVNAPAAASR